ncbi:MAG: hypothetical protein ACLFWD_01770 [Anaerolineales bacterium]
MDYLLGLDDTDDHSSRGTGYRARQLGRWLQFQGLARVNSITRHQLSAAEGIPKTSKNSAACLHLWLNIGDMDRLQSCLIKFLSMVAAPTAQPGVCLAPAGSVAITVQRFGRICKEGVVELTEAIKRAEAASMWLATTDDLGSGRIGAMAAVGLRASGEDGRYIWLPELRSLKGVTSVMELSSQCGIDVVCSPDGAQAAPMDRIRLNSWIRPLLRAGQPRVLVESVEGRDEYEWKLLDKGRVKQLDK